jgi:hypothetical protein
VMRTTSMRACHCSSDKWVVTKCDNSRCQGRVLPCSARDCPKKWGTVGVGRKTLRRRLLDSFERKDEIPICPGSSPPPIVKSSSNSSLGSVVSGALSGESLGRRAKRCACPLKNVGRPGSRMRG